MAQPEWFLDLSWARETVVIVASGPSAKDQPLELARGKTRFIAVNNSWLLCPWADILYACDYRWWHANEGCPDFAGIKATIADRAADHLQHPTWGVQGLRCQKNDDRLLLQHKGTIGWGANSGFGALNIAAQLDVKNIILVGFDMTVEFGSHWHGDHQPRLGNPRDEQLRRWRAAIDGAQPILAEAEIAVYNCSPLSALKAYRKTTFAEALGECSVGFNPTGDEAGSRSDAVGD